LLYIVISMPTLPWKQINRPTGSNNYIVMLTYLPLKHFNDSLRFSRYVLRVMNQLKDTNGIIGYSLKANPLKKKLLDSFGLERR